MRAFSRVMRLAWMILLAWAVAAPAQEAATGADRVIAENPRTAGIVDRILSVVASSDPRVLTGRERFEQYLLNTIGPVPVIGEALGAGINQWTNTPGEWGQGWGAYGKRYAGNLGYNAVRQTIAYAVATPLHEDSRYFLSRRQGVWPRTRYALMSTFFARHPDGSRRFAVSSVSGVLGAVAAQSAWGPASMQTAGSAGINAAISFGVSAGFNVVREFLPDLLHRRK